MLRFLSIYLQKKLYFASQPIRQYTRNEKLQILRENHDLAQHLGENKTITRIKDQHYWTNIDTDVQTYIQNCDVCQRTKLMRIRPREEAIITDTPDEPNDKVTIDIIGPLPLTTQGNQFVLSIQDCLTKYILLVPLPERNPLSTSS